MEISLRRTMQWALPTALAMFSQAAMALGLGNATVESYLNQPLQARIDLIARPGEALDDVTVALASADDFALIGASREAISVPLRFMVDAADGAPRVLVTSTLPIKDPIIRLVVELTWPSGRMLREYTLFLDPPTVPAAAPSPVIDERREGLAAPAAPSRPAEPELTEAEAPGQPREAAAVPEGGEYGPVQSGETLWDIAIEWSRGTGLNVNQVMLAIQRENPQAFINGNINLLRRGAILRMPRQEDVESLSLQAARTEVQAQHAAFGLQPAAVVPAAPTDTPLIAEASMPPGDAERGGEAGPDAQLEIVPPSESDGAESADETDAAGTDPAASASAAELREELARAEEELIGERQENDYLRERIAELESQLADVEAGTVADAELAALEERLREERLAGDEEAAGGADAAGPATAVPQVSSGPPPAAHEPWYQSVAVWALLVLVVGAAATGWFLSRRQVALTSPVPGAGRAEGETVRGIKDEAEEILRVLEPGESSGGKAAGAGRAQDESQKPPEPKRASGTASREEAEVLDEDSEDPEVRLDLARAYIAMGDREAARVILDEVIQHGTEAQQSEARSMLDELK